MRSVGLVKDGVEASTYIRLILKAKVQRARINTVGTALHSYIRKSPNDGITILKFLYGQL